MKNFGNSLFKGVLGVSLVLAGSFFSIAQAAQKLIPGQSEIVFISKQMNVPVQGYFKKFDANIQLDPAKLDTSKVNVTVDMASATLGVSDTDAELPKATWFNTAKFAQASFASTRITKQADGKYKVDGKLTIKGTSQNISLLVAMQQTGATTVASGTFPIKRLQFKIGENEWSDTSMVADEVQVKFKFTMEGVGKL